MGQAIVKRPACELSPGWESGMWTWTILAESDPAHKRVYRPIPIL